MNRPKPDTAPPPEPPASAEPDVARIVWVEPNGTAWRLRSLVAMGHSATRIAGALGVRVESVQKLLRGDAALIGADLRRLASQLWEAWWDKRPPETTAAERRAAAEARRRAETHNWCAPVGLDEDQLDEPGYRPYCRYRPASGSGVADDFQPADFAASEQAEDIA
ncbi:MAG TPA: hypothetical protein VFI65_18810 [Streptosporangiaceae bacterium]|nr:hypothetical protein [Streptosporangiaceae bacterium]